MSDRRPTWGCHQTAIRPVTTELEAGERSCPTPSEWHDFGAALFTLRNARGLTQRALAHRAQIAISVLSESENGRRRPPPEATVLRLCTALNATGSECQELCRLADLDRMSIGLRVSRSTPRHVADLLRDISRIGHQLSTRQVAAIRIRLTEVAMK